MTLAAAATADLPFLALPEQIAAHARAQPTAPALRCEGQTLTWAALDARMDRVAAALQRDGAPVQGCVAICAASSNDYLAVFLGALRGGLAAAPLAPGATPAQLADMLRDSGAQHLFLDGATATALASQALPQGLRQIRLDAPGDTAGHDTLDQWLTPEGARPSPVTISPEWAFNIIYSSGTTGTPKGIVQAHAMRWAQVRRAEASGYGPDTRTLIATPLYSNTTLVAVIPTLAGGGCITLLPRFDATRYLTLAQAERITHTMLVPVQYQRLMAHPDFDRFDLASFRFKACTSAPFHAALKAEVLRRWPGGLTEYYGMTEGGGSCILACHEHPSKLHTVGRPMDGHDMRLIDEEGQEMPPPAAGEESRPGEVVGRSAAMMQGYHGQPGKTREAEWFDAQGQRFIRTGDVGRFDADGFLILMDRRKDMIISGGFNLYPSDLEAELRQHGDVAEAAVVGVPSSEWGETPVAFVVLQPHASATAEDLREWLNARVGKTQRLTGVVLAKELPRSPIGKVLKRELREQWVASAAIPASPAPL